MKRQSARKKHESSVEFWERECPGQFLYVIRFGPEPRRRKRRKKPAPIVPQMPPAVSPRSVSVAEPAQVVEPPRARSREFA